MKNVRASEDELKFKSSGYADFHGIWYNPHTSTRSAAYMEGHFRPYFNFAKGDVSVDIKLELDPIMGSVLWHEISEAAPV